MNRAPSPCRPQTLLLLAGLAASVAACGAAPMASPAGAKSAEAAATQSPAPPPANVDEATAELERAEAAVDRALGGGRRFAEAPVGGVASNREHTEEDKRKASSQGMPAQPAAAPPPPMSPVGPHAERAAADDKSGAAELSSQSPCVTACRALASMERAVEHLCGLAGSADARCESARMRARTAAERVRSGCPACPAE